jgi:hypothetical protein
VTFSATAACGKLVTYALQPYHYYILATEIKLLHYTISFYVPERGRRCTWLQKDLKKGFWEEKKTDTSLSELSLANLPSRGGAAVKTWDRQLRRKIRQSSVPAQWKLL